MATATVHITPPPPPPPPPEVKVTLELSANEAQALAWLLGSVGGQYDDTPRVHLSEVSTALREVGFYNAAAMNLDPSSVYKTGTIGAIISFFPYLLHRKSNGALVRP
jgi:hypothetical protein